MVCIKFFLKKVGGDSYEFRPLRTRHNFLYGGSKVTRCVGKPDRMHSEGQCLRFVSLKRVTVTHMASGLLPPREIYWASLEAIRSACFIRCGTAAARSSSGGKVLISPLCVLTVTFFTLCWRWRQHLEDFTAGLSPEVFLYKLPKACWGLLLCSRSESKYINIFLKVVV